METLPLLLFCASLILCIMADASILWALTAGLIIFILDGLKKGFSPKELLQTALSGVMEARNVLITFFLIGILTALWRAAGTIPAIICCSAALIHPAVFLLMTFILNCAVSVLTGTAFGTAATMGVICATMARSIDIPLFLVGGAVLSGVYFGDRCSPVSTSALLVSELTETKLFLNIKHMLRSALIPFAATCLFYTAVGFFVPHSGRLPNLTALFVREFHIHWLAFLPAVLILILSVCRVNVKITMTASILLSVPICICLQNVRAADLLPIALLGYRARDAELASMLDGGGILSMLRVAAIVCLSSAYSGLFQKTGVLNRLQRAIRLLGQRTTPYAVILGTSVLAGAIACNQTLTILLTHQLCGDLEASRQRFALDLENTAVLAAPLIPWSIAGAVPLASIGAPLSSLPAAVFLYALPLWQLFLSFTDDRHTRRCDGSDSRRVVQAMDPLPQNTETERSRTL